MALQATGETPNKIADSSDVWSPFLAIFLLQQAPDMPQIGGQTAANSPALHTYFLPTMPEPGSTINLIGSQPML